MNRYLSHHLHRHLQKPTTPAAPSLEDADGSMTGEELNGSNKENNYLSGEHSALTLMDVPKQADTETADGMPSLLYNEENGSLNSDHQPMHETLTNIDGGRHCDEYYCQQQQTTPGGVSPPKMPSNPGASLGMLRPVARHPPSLEPPAPPGIKSGPLLLRPQHRQQQSDSSIGHEQPSFRPSGLHLALDLDGYGDTDFLPKNAPNVQVEINVGAGAPRPRNKNPIPQLPMRPILTKKELKMPSPLARRGPAERAYLQGQLKAEAQRRRKQEQHNNERRQRCSWQEWGDCADHQDDTNNAMTDTDIQSMIEKFKFGFDDRGKPPTNKLKFLPKKKNSRNNLPEFGAASPPAILKKTFKRSVSAVLEDSGIDEDGNLLFFPDGGPLLEVENEQSPHPLTEFADCLATSSSTSRTTSPNSQGNTDPQEGGSVSCGADDNKSDVVVDAASSPRCGGFILSHQESTYDSEEDEVSPSLIAADVIWQLGAVTIDDAGLSMPMNKEHHKKVTLRPKTKGNNITSTPLGQFKPIDGSHSSDSLASSSGLGVPSSKNDVVAQANTSSSDGEGPPLPPFKFESPDKFYSFKGDKMGGSESFQQLSFDESENRSERKERTPYDGCNNDCGKHSSSFVFASPDVDSFNCQTPDNSFNDRHSYRSKQGSKGLDASLRGESISKVTPSSGLAGNQLDSFSYCTPDNSEHRRSSRRQLSERMPKLPELALCLDDSFHDDTLLRPLQDGQASRAMEREAAFSGDISTNGLLLKEPLSESNFCTPDNSFHEKKPFPKFGLDDIPSLPSLGMMNPKWFV